MAKNNKMPAIRFSGYTDAWEQRKLGDFYTFKNGLNKEKVYFGYGDSIVNFTDVFHNRQIYSSTLKGKVFVNKKELENFKVKEGDLFFTRTSETIDEIGFPAVVMEPMERVVFSGFVLRGRAEKNDPLVNIFKSYIFFTDNFRSEMKKKSSMTTRALTSGTALKEMYFSYPKDLEEQTKIGEILLRLDNVITLHQRKLEKLKLTKKALLQKLFPKNGSNIPELRFKGFTNAWEQRKLNDLVTIRRGLTYKPSDIAENGIRVLRSSNIDEDQFITSNDDVFVNIEAVNIPFAKNGDILITSANGSNRLVGKHTIIRDIADNSAVHGGFMLLAESNNPLFTDALLSSNWYKRFINTYVAGGNGAIGNLSKSDLESQIVMVPSEHEQAKIGQWYDNINQLITLHQRKLEMLKNVKKGLLQKMFV